MGHEADNDPPALAEVAYVHEPYWDIADGGLIKAMLLYFDAVAVLVPDYIRGRAFREDPALAGPLFDRGLMHELSPESLVNERAASELAAIVDELLSIGAFEDLAGSAPMRELSYSRLGGFGDEEMAQHIIAELRRRGLAGETRDGHSYPIHEAVRSLILAVLPQLIKNSAEAQGFAIQPLVYRPIMLDALTTLLRHPISPSAGAVVTSDMSAFDLDLTDIPLDEVLSFRSEHGELFRRYGRDLRHFVREVSQLKSGEARSRAMADRHEELRDEASRLRSAASSAWRKRAGSLVLGVAGSAVSIATGSPIGGGIAAASALFGLTRQADTGSAYSYILQAQRTFER
jgi:hypothetical protein